MRDDNYKPYNKMFKDPVSAESEKKVDVPVEEAGPKEEPIKDISPEPIKVEAAPVIEPKKEVSKKAKIVNAAFVNFRQKPVKDNTPPIGVLARDTGIEVVSDKLENDFYKVKSLTGKVGYIHKDYVEIV